MNKTDTTMSGLLSLGFARTEAIIYLQLLKRPATHAQLSAATDINRTTLYRIVSKLQKQGLVTLQVGDQGKFLVAAEPSALEVEIVNLEARAWHQRAAFGQLLPALEAVHANTNADFTIRDYEGIDGFKRMLWHELKTKGDYLCIGVAALEELVENKSWADKHRQLSIKAGYRIREITNPDNPAINFCDTPEFMELYEQRVVPTSVIAISYLIATYNDTVAIYHTNNSYRRGLEIISKPYAATIRSIFELCWQMGVNQ